MIAPPKIKRIMFATDFLASSRLALDYAVAFGRHFKATLTMIHALELSSPAIEAELVTHRPCVTRKLAQERLEVLANTIRHTGLDVETFVEEGIPSDVVLRAVDDHAADLLVLGVHGVHRGLAHLLIGSNTEKILLAANCPTMTVGAHVMTGVDPNLHFNEILYFSDFSPEAVAVAPYAAFLGKEFHAPIDVCQLTPEESEGKERVPAAFVEEFCEATRKAFRESDPAWRLPSFHLDRSMALHEILDRAQTQCSGLIVLGVRPESQLRRHMHTSFAYQLLAKATCPVISVRYRTI